MGATDGVEVVILQELQFPLDALHRNGAAVLGIMLMAVDALEGDGGIIDQQAVTLDANIAEADVLGVDLHFPAALQKGNVQGIKVRGLGVPVAGIFHRKRKFHRLCGRLGDRLPVQLHGHGGVRIVGIPQGHKDGDLVLMGDDLIVPHRQRFGLHQQHVAENTAGQKHILIFEVRAVAVGEHLNAQKIFPVAEQVGHVVLGGQTATLGKTHVHAVEPHKINGIHAAEVEDATGSLVRGKAAAVVAYRILAGDVGRVKGDGVLHVGVHGRAVAPILPHGGHVDGIPVAVVVVRREEIRKGILGTVGEAEVSVQGGNARRRGMVAVGHAATKGGDNGGAGRQTALALAGGIL